MNVPALTDRYGRLPAILAITWVAVVSIMVLADHGHWRHLARLTQTGATPGEMKALELRIGTLEQQWTAQKQQPAPLSAERFTERASALDERLSRLEQGVDHGASKEDLDSLTARVGALEAIRAQRAQVTARKPITAVISAPAEAPFRVLGLEMRGGEAFLAIAPPQAVSLAEMSVLRVGDVQAGWQLQSLDNKSAIFLFQGQPHRLELP